MEFLFVITLLFLVLIAYRLYIVERRLSRIFGKSRDTSFEGVVAGHAEALTRVQGELGRLASAHEALTDSFTASVQKVSMLRFNPFSDSGGDQSFAIALLDGQNNGFVLSGLYVQGRPMVYAKPIARGQSHYTLSAEEASVLTRAIETA